MIKTEKYYRNLDLADAARQLKGLGPNRGRPDVTIFGDAILALHFHGEKRRVSCDEIRQVLGQPDEIQHIDDRSIWIYHWQEYYGPTLINGSTPFVIQNNTLLGIDREQEQETDDAHGSFLTHDPMAEPEFLENPPDLHPSPFD